MLQQIQTNGETYPLNFGIRTMATVADSLGLTLDKLVQNAHTPDLPFSDMVNMILAVTAVAMSEGARKAGIPHYYNEDNVVDLIDEDSDLLPKLIEMFRASMSNGGPVFQMGTGATPRESKKTPVSRKRGKR